MDDRKLRALLTVLSAGSLNSAAERLACTQSAVTQMMNSIENELGVPVLTRTNKGVALTREGKQLLPYVVAADAALTELAEEAGRIATGSGTKLIVGTFSSISGTWLPGAIHSFRKQRPDVSFEILVGTENLPVLLEEGGVHLNLTDEYRRGQGTWYPIMEDPFYAVVPEKYAMGEKSAVTLEELRGYPLIAASLDMHFEGAEEILAAPGTIRVQADDNSPILRMVSKELGIALLPELSLRAAQVPDNVLLLDVEPPLRRRIGVALPKKPIRAAREFAAFLRDHASELSRM
ncbi:MAG: LysR family transcriptional regulator [Clostridium sp.]|nr:LysR family transcriptional regulator [Clostridium sp.]